MKNKDIENDSQMASIAARKLARRIQELRRQRGLTQEKAARAYGIKYKYYQEHESRSPRDMRLSTMEKIAKGLGIRLSDLLRFD